jgi:hypothetical protein
VVVVLPASMWAMIPIFRTLAMLVGRRLIARIDGMCTGGRQHRLATAVFESESEVVSAEGPT